MLIARAPVRVSFFGGGTDLPAYYLRYGGSVLSTTINKYVYVIMNVSEQDVLQITSSDYQTFYRHPPGEPLLWDGDLSFPRAVLHHFGVEHGVSMFLASEVPPGTGLGSSSSVTVALIKAVSVARGLKLSKAQVAEMAVQIELEKMGKPIGVQDQYAAAFGGLNCFTFDTTGIHAEPIDLPAATLNQLESNLLLMFTGSARDSAEILSRQTQASQQRDPIVIEALQAVHELSRRAHDYLVRGEVDQFGVLLHEAWQHKKRFAAGVTNARIDQVYEQALRHGALGGKITGAGGGGFLMLYCPSGTIESVAAALAGEGLRRMEFRFEQDGARVLFNAGLRL
jgi:D-glycero-alpha-D-manno-heptose-7-phosphate kinase